MSAEWFLLFLCSYPHLKAYIPCMNDHNYCSALAFVCCDCPTATVAYASQAPSFKLVLNSLRD